MILVTGAKGQLGLSLKKVLPAKKTVFTDLPDLDISNYDAVEKIIREKGITSVVNCAAYTNVDSAEANIDQAYAVNAFGARNIAIAAAKHKASVIHISTDYVFDGNNFKPYTEADQPNPISVYGQTKLEGELFVLKNTKECVILRSSWLYSEYGKNFVKSIISLARKQDEIKVIYDQIGSPTYAGDLAGIIEGLIPVVKNGVKKIYNYSHEGVCSWYGFAREIISLKNIDCEVLPIESQEYPSSAKRPHYSVLSKAKIKKDFGIKIPYWRDSLKKAIVKIDEK
ncbi:MAG: dTDP-4-dehydrorhamnose reductase [Elusimicrobiota bacterium]|jgi:dTDP-4-dehydrorhamnose reductase|nr:dTDP-4-dehydrorhamnose reductase [Elusimicrobiota bacterium]